MRSDLLPTDKQTQVDDGTEAGRDGRERGGDTTAVTTAVSHDRRRQTGLEIVRGEEGGELCPLAAVIAGSHENFNYPPPPKQPFSFQDKV